MKRDPDLERDILLAIEAYDGESRPGYADLSSLEAPDLQVKYQVVLLHEAGLIQATDAATLQNRFAMMPIRLTMSDTSIWTRSETTRSGDARRGSGRRQLQPRRARSAGQGSGAREGPQAHRRRG